MVLKGLQCSLVHVLGMGILQDGIIPPLYSSSLPLSFHEDYSIL